MQRQPLFNNQVIIEEINRKANSNKKEVFIEDMVNGAYYRCFGVVFDDDGNLILRCKSLEDLYDGVHDLYTKVDDYNE